jgi:hypothetical protein
LEKGFLKLKTNQSWFRVIFPSGLAKVAIENYEQLIITNLSVNEVI